MELLKKLYERVRPTKSAAQEPAKSRGKVYRNERDIPPFTLFQTRSGAHYVRMPDGSRRRIGRVISKKRAERNAKSGAYFHRALDLHAARILGIVRG